jgi:hypothetical protein
MTNNASDSPQHVVLSNVVPPVLRAMMGCAGVTCCFLIVKELGSGLWPPSFLTLFFGFMVLGGLSVGLSFIAFAVFGPNETWTIEAGKITIRNELLGQVQTMDFLSSDFSSFALQTHNDSEGGDTYFLAATLKNNPVQPIFNNLGFGRNLANDVISGLMRPVFPNQAYDAYNAVHRLRSPFDRSKTRIEEALSIFKGNTILSS